MRFLVEGKHTKTYEVIAREWTGDSYKPDCFGDIADNETKGLVYNHELDAWETTKERFEEIVEWWEAELKNWSEGYNDAGAEFDPIEIELFVNEL